MGVIFIAGAGRDGSVWTRAARWSLSAAQSWVSSSAASRARLPFRSRRPLTGPNPTQPGLDRAGSPRPKLSWLVSRPQAGAISSAKAELREEDEDEDAEGGGNEEGDGNEEDDYDEAAAAPAAEEEGEGEGEGEEGALQDNARQPASPARAWLAEEPLLLAGSELWRSMGARLRPAGPPNDGSRGAPMESAAAAGGANNHAAATSRLELARLVRGAHRLRVGCRARQVLQFPAAGPERWKTPANYRPAAGSREANLRPAHRRKQAQDARPEQPQEAGAPRRRPILDGAGPGQLLELTEWLELELNRKCRVASAGAIQSQRIGSDRGG